jgi:hypothetical protein
MREIVPRLFRCSAVRGFCVPRYEQHFRYEIRRRPSEDNDSNTGLELGRRSMKWCAEGILSSGILAPLLRTGTSVELLTSNISFKWSSS